MKVLLPSSNTASRVLPIRIHELDVRDKKLVEAKLRPRLVFDDENWVNVPGYSYDISPNGKRFLMVRRQRNKSTNEIKVSQNFLESGN